MKFSTATTAALVVAAASAAPAPEPSTFEKKAKRAPATQCIGDDCWAWNGVGAYDLSVRAPAPTDPAVVECIGSDCVTAAVGINKRAPATQCVGDDCWAWNGVGAYDLSVRAPAPTAPPTVQECIDGECFAEQVGGASVSVSPEKRAIQCIGDDCWTWNGVGATDLSVRAPAPTAPTVQECVDGECFAEQVGGTSVSVSPEGKRAIQCIGSDCWTWNGVGATDLSVRAAAPTPAPAKRAVQCIGSDCWTWNGVGATDLSVRAPAPTPAPAKRQTVQECVDGECFAEQVGGTSVSVSPEKRAVQCIGDDCWTWNGVGATDLSVRAPAPTPAPARRAVQCIGSDCWTWNGVGATDLSVRAPAPSAPVVQECVDGECFAEQVGGTAVIESPAKRTGTGVQECIFGDCFEETIPSVSIS